MPLTLAKRLMLIFYLQSQNKLTSELHNKKLTSNPERTLFLVKN